MSGGDDSNYPVFFTAVWTQPKKIPEQRGGFMFPEEFHDALIASVPGPRQRKRPTRRERLQMWVDGVRERIALMIAPWLR